MSVLIIDDDETFCRFLAELLEPKGFQVTWTTDGLAGFDMALHRCYDLFIVDVRMPLVAGTDLAQNLKRENPKAKVILISAFADASLAKTAARLGAPLISKPFSASRLYEVIAATLGRPV